MEPITCPIGTSTIILEDEGLTIHISRSFWSNRHWHWLVQLMTQWVVAGLAWVLAPALSSAHSSDPEQSMPRWKQMSIDGLSYLLFVLLIPANHPLRQLYAAYDWPKIDEKCAALYKNHQRGAPAYAPQVLFRVLVLMFYSGTPFESTTLQRLSTDVAWRWFVGLSLLRPVPNAGTLSYFRSRLGVARFEEILIDLIVACDAAGLIGHLESYYDLTGVEASATQVTPYQRAVILARALSAYLDEAQGGVGVISREQIAAIALEVLAEQHPSLKEVKPAQIVFSQDQLEEKLHQTVKSEPNWWQRLWQQIASLRQRLSGTPQKTLDSLRTVARQLLPTLPQAFGNPDATVGHTRTDGTLCGYRSGFLIDAQRWIIIAVIFISLREPEAPTVIEALDKYEAIFHRHPHFLGLDRAFDQDGVHQYVEKHEIYAGIAVRTRPGPAGVFRSEVFRWNEAGELCCPTGEVMAPAGGPYKNGQVRYRATGPCSQCPLRDQCLTAKQQQRAEPRREMHINPAAHQRAQRARERSRSPEGRALHRRRFASEGLFGHLNRYHNGDKAPYRSEEMDHIAQLIVAFVSNLEKLARYG